MTRSGKERWLPILTAASVFVFLELVFISRGSHSNSVYSEYLLKSLERPMKYDDPQLIKYVRDKVLDPPSDKPYNFSLRNVIEYKTASEYFYGNYTQDLFGSKRNGFFIEAGALDGQTMSNTVGLEKNFNWTGLLIEPDPTSYTALRNKNRKAWSANACVSVEKYTKQEIMFSFDIVNPGMFRQPGHRSMGSIVNRDGTMSITNGETNNSYYVAQCLRLESFLVALNVTKIDLLSLDVEFLEEKIIRNFDFDRFNIQAIYLEWWFQSKYVWLKSFLESKGYIFVARTETDIIFVKANTDLEAIVKKKFLKRDFFLMVLKNETGKTDPRQA